MAPCWSSIAKPVLAGKAETEKDLRSSCRLMRNLGNQYPQRGYDIYNREEYLLRSKLLCREWNASNTIRFQVLKQPGIAGALIAILEIPASVFDRTTRRNGVRD